MTQALRTVISRRRLLAVLAVLAALAATLGLLTRPAQAHATTGCSVQTLKGNYAGNVSGVTAATGPVALQALATFNGNGTGTSSITLMTETSGPVAVTSTITYTLNSNCTGMATSVRSTGQTVHYAIAVTGLMSDDESVGVHLHVLGVDPGSVVTGTLEHV
jgi:hypothetical protein